MSREIDEDLIEATIRRVAESAAAASSTPPSAPAEDGVPPPDVLRDRPIEPNAVEADGQDESAEGEDPKTLERLRFDDHESFGTAGGPRRFSASRPGGLTPSPWAPAPAAVDDDDFDAQPEAVELAIADEDASASPTAAAAEDDVVDGPSPVTAATASGLGWPKAMPVSRPSARWDQGSDRDEPEPPSRPALAPASPVAPAPVPQPASAATLADIAAAIDDINGRLDRITALIERLAANAQDPGWNAPDYRVTSLPARQEPITRGAVAAQLQPDRIDTRPLPQPLPPLHVEPKRGLELLPRTYRITVEDKRQGVDLVPLHRALLGMDGVKDMSLLSYNNGVAIVALETNGDIDPDVLRAAVARAMQREAQVEVHNEHTMVLKLAEE